MSLTREEVDKFLGNALKVECNQKIERGPTLTVSQGPTHMVVFKDNDRLHPIYIDSTREDIYTVTHRYCPDEKNVLAIYHLDEDLPSRLDLSLTLKEQVFTS
jgi:hypothetical protein